MYNFKLKLNLGFNNFKHVVSKEELRPSLNGVNLNIKRKRIECTDSYVLVCYPIHFEGESEIESCVLPLYVFDKKRYYSRHCLKNVTMDAFEFKVDLENNIVYVYFLKKEVYKGYLIEDKYPNCEAVLNVTKQEGIEEMYVSLSLLNNIRLATKSKSNTIKFKTNGSNKAITFKNEDGVFGLIMPSFDKY